MRKNAQEVRTINPRVAREIEDEAGQAGGGPQLGPLNGPQGPQAPKLKKPPPPPAPRGAGQPVKGRPPKAVR